jgi:hypothetical protein
MLLKRKKKTLIYYTPLPKINIKFRGNADLRHSRIRMSIIFKADLDKN